jgi:site-specific DNA-methyltransferase (adenine-specific)
LICDKKNKWAGESSFGKSSFREKNGELIKKNKIDVKEFSVRENIWEVANGYGFSSTDEIAFKHPAIFPEKLARDHIYSWSNEGDLVYDCFGGSGTVAKMAHKLKRNWILSEISSEYCDLANKRLHPYLSQIELF